MWGLGMLKSAWLNAAASINRWSYFHTPNPRQPLLNLQLNSMSLKSVSYSVTKMIVHLRDHKRTLELSHYGTRLYSLHAEPPRWRICSFPNLAPLLCSPPTFLFASVLILILSHDLFFPTIFKLLHFVPLLFSLRHSYLCKVVRASSTYEMKQQCPLKEERIPRCSWA